MTKQELSSLQSSLINNDVLVNDNRIDHLLDEDTAVDSSSVSVCNGIDISNLKMIKDAGFPEKLYLCIIANSRRIETIRTFIGYLFS